MKNIINKIKYGLLLFLFAISFSCNEQDYLQEVPLDFFSPENSYVTMGNFESALTDLYARVRDINYHGDNTEAFAHFMATDIAKHARGDANRFGDYSVWIVPTNSLVKFHWTSWYKVVSNANTILARLDGSELTEQQKKSVSAEAKFFRAFAYRYLVYLYGGVPLILDEIISPKTDFSRATKDEVLKQMALDFTEASQNLPSIANVADGKVSNIVASHYLAETYISLGKFDQAVAEATKVIDDPNTSLMTSRFGKKASVNPGDPYWDLFQQGNQNRLNGSNNKEALWVAQMEVDVPGGFLESTRIAGNALERWAGPVAWLTFKDPAGKEGTLTKGQSNYNAGGRGVGFMRNTDFYLFDLWQSDWNTDKRNAPNNLMRDFIYNNPASAYYGKSAVNSDGTSNSSTWKSQHWRWYPYPTKITTAGDHPDELFEDKDLLTLKSTAGSTFRDMYILRLAETYLLRAEAYLGKGDKLNAAKDINMVRSRSGASSVVSSNVTIDYILDERARELVYEEPRRITLCRTGKLVERVRKYNDLNADDIQDFNNLWPIPYSEIEANKGVVIEQNPGYNN